MMCVCASSGAWADDYYISTDTWFENVSTKTEQVVKIKIETPGSLATAIAAVGQSQYGVMYINVVDGSYLNDADITALSDITVGTIDLQDAKYTADGAAFTFTNSSVKNVILPDGWTKAEVKACAQAVGSNLGSAYSQRVVSDSEAELVAYVNKPGSLREAMEHCFLDNKANNKIGTGVNRYSQSFEKIKYASLMGNVAARDFNGGTENKYDQDGHFEFNVAADETSMARNAGVGGVARELQGTTMVGALVGAGLISLDLEDALITDAHCDDLNLAWSNVINDNTKEIKIPTTSDLTILPADFLNVTAKSFEEICIPGNIQVIRTRAIYLADSNIRHIWTTGTKTLAEGEVDHTVYDNGAYLLNGKVMHKGHAPLDDPNWNKQSSTAVRYGTITLPPNLTLIESHAFKSDFISDVYSLNKTAPECHVDAFSSVMYMGNNTINGDVNGMITRESYAVSTDEAKYIAFLHYPRECGTPDIQRYTDPTREYSVATTLRDGKGNVIYFPNQSELNRAYYQGMTGYLWYAWNSHRTPEFYNNANSFDEADISSSGGGFYHTSDIQKAANNLYKNNDMEDVPDKTDRSFYDVRLGGTEQPTEEKPSDLKWYYNTVWEGQNLYPEMQYTNTETYLGQQQKLDENGKPKYVEGDCDFVQDYTIKKAANGNLVENINVDANGAKVRDYSYDEDPEGRFVHEIIIAEAEDGNKVIDFEYQEATEGMYYHPLVAATASSPRPWYGRVASYKECPLSEATHAGPNGNTGWLITIEQWGDGSSYSWAANSVKFYREVYEYVERDYVDGNYSVSSGYALWSATATDIAENINDTRYNRVPLVPTTYRDYNAETDFGETRYNVTDNGIRAYVGAADDEAGYTRYTKNYANTLRDYDASTDADEIRYTVGSGYRSYVANADPDSWLQRYTKTYIAGTYRAFDATKDAEDETRYCPDMEDVYGIVKGKQNDYRGWHQFILTAYATNDDRPITPIKFYQNDKDWWTVCLPYDLTYNDMIRFFGNQETGEIPYLSKLRYVVRDYDQKKITLMFSKNLMEYKEDIAAMNPGATDMFVHGKIDDKTKYTQEELETDPVILHEGVPYLIRPNIDTTKSRSFDVYKNGHEDANEELYQRLVDSQNKDAGALETMIYKGEYTVPAYVVGENIPEEVVDSKDFEHAAGPTFSYSSSDKIMYQGKEISAKISNDFSYTFVGSFFLSMLPQYCYFLGWDSKQNKAAFWYNRVTNPSSYDWNNQTGVICANFSSSNTIHRATSLSDPARWVLASSAVSNDDLIGVNVSGAKKNTLATMDWGGSIFVDDEEDGVITDINEVKTRETGVTSVYTVGGVYVGSSVEGLAKGLYIVNGKKYVVK